MQRLLTKILIIVFLSGAIFWMTFVISTTLLPKGNPIASFITSALGLPEDFQAKPKIVTGQPRTFDDYMYSDYFYNFYALSSFVLITGLFTLTKSRNIIEKYMLIQAYALPRERDYWGRITDKKHMAVPFATVRLLRIKDDQEEFIAQTVADLDGRYRMYVSENMNYDNLYIEIKSAGFETHKQKLRKIFIENDKQIRVPVILNKINEDPDTNLLRLYIARHRSRILQILGLYIFFLSMTTFFHAIYSTIYHFNFVSIGDLIFYGFAAPWNVFVLLERRKFNPGQFIDTVSKKPIANVNVKVYLKNSKVITLLSDEDGIIKFDEEPGKYKIKAEKPGFKAEETNNLEVEFNKEGYLTKHIYLKPVDASYSNLKPELRFQNPFGNRDS